MSKIKTSILLLIIPPLSFVLVNLAVLHAFYLNDIIQGHYAGNYVDYEMGWYGKAVQAFAGLYSLCKLAVIIIKDDQERSSFFVAFTASVALVAIAIYIISSSSSTSPWRTFEVLALLGTAILGAWLPHYNAKN